MNLRQFDLNLLVALDALLTERNVTRAAERLFLSQSAMSGRLARLRLRARMQLGTFHRNGPGGWRILDEPKLDVLVPDIAGWHRERMPVLPAETYFTLTPNWVCEVLSPSTESLDRGKKLQR